MYKFEKIDPPPTLSTHTLMKHVKYYRENKKFGIIIVQGITTTTLHHHHHLFMD